MADTDKFWTAKEVSVCLRLPQLTISETARREVLARLLQLNHDRYEEEVRQVLHEKEKRRKKSSLPGRNPKNWPRLNGKFTYWLNRQSQTRRWLERL